MIIYADITFLNNFLMTLAIIWAVGHLLEYNYLWWRLILSALLGTIYTFIVLFLQFYIFPGFLKILLQITLNIFTALLMIRVAFIKINRKEFWKGVAYLYLISFITIGTTLSIFYIYGGTPFKTGGEWLFIFLGLFVLIIIGKYGWRLLQNYVTPDQFYLPVKIIFNNREVELTGLIDTGNSLTDPLTKVPVIVVSLQDIAPLFTKELQEQLLATKKEDLELLNIFNNFGLGSRVRILPFSGLGQEHGILVGFRPDMVIINYKDKVIKTSRIIMALNKHKLDEKGEYQILVHPQTIKLQV